MNLLVWHPLIQNSRVWPGENGQVADNEARRWFVAGRVQGVGFRQFVLERAQALKITGWTRNLSDGRVEVMAVGSKASLSDLASALHKGSTFSNVRSVEELVAAPELFSKFEVR